MKKPLEALKQYFKYDAFRAPQEAIINNVLEKRDALVLLPTGAGKSLCFQIPALIEEGVCIVISPLIALMQDQVASLKKKNIKAVTITSSLKQDDIVQLFDNIRYGGIKFLYLSPERLQSDFIQEKIRQLNVSLIAIDEAHCISEWGHDFRPSYRKTAILKEIHPDATIIALTASATAKVFEDIKNNLNIPKAAVFKASLKRPELTYSIEKTNDINYSLSDILKKKNAPSIVYTSSRKSTKNIHYSLNSNGLKSSYYHGGLSFDEKQIAYKNWLNETTPIMVATNAFGMGIDKNNVSTIVHAELPFSLENYIQESGRAGRNGNESNAYLLYNEATIHEFKKRFENSVVSINFIKEVFIKLNQFYRIANGEKPNESFIFNLNEFCTHYNLNTYKTFTAIDILNKEDIIELNENLQKKSQLKFLIGHHHLLAYAENRKKTGKLIKTMLRTYGGLFDQLVNIDEFIIAKKVDSNITDVKNRLNKLHNKQIVDYLPVTSGQSLQFLVPREDNYSINTIVKNIKQRFNIKQEKFDAVLSYVENTSICRSKFLLAYFGESNLQNCGKCDICKQESTTKANYSLVASRVLELLKTNEVLSAKEIVSNLNLDKKTVLTTLQLLLDKNKLSLTSQNKFQVNKNA